MFGRKQMKLVSQYIETRTLTQVHSHAQKYFKKQAHLEQQARHEAENTGSGEIKPALSATDLLSTCEDSPTNLKSQADNQCANNLPDRSLIAPVWC